MDCANTMKTSALIIFLVLASGLAHGQAPNCEEQKVKLKADIRAVNGCEAKHQTCLNMGPTNPMRELDYCRNLLQKCESMNGPFEDDKLREQVEQFKAACS